MTNTLTVSMDSVLTNNSYSVNKQQTHYWYCDGVRVRVWGLRMGEEAELG